MSDRLREDIKRVSRNYGAGYLKPGAGIRGVLAAARRFLALTETGRVENLRRVIDNDECRWSEDGQYVTLPREHHNVLWNFADEFLADYLTEDSQ